MKHTAEVFNATRAPSTVGTWLRSYRRHNIRQLDAVSREFLKRLWAAGGGPADLAGPLTIDLDSTIVPVYGRAKPGAAFGYTKTRGYHPQLATLAQSGQVLFSRPRGGSASAARCPKSFLTETVGRARYAGASGQLTVRADSAFYSRDVLLTARKPDVRFSITVRQDPKIKAAIAAIPDDAWTPIPYSLSTPEVSGADVAETIYTCFAQTRTPVTVRLIVRRVRPTPGSQLALFTTYDHHAFVTDRAGDLTEVEADDRRHAVVEQTIAEPKSAGPAHLPSGRFTANAAWLALAALAHSLGRAVGILAGHDLTGPPPPPSSAPCSPSRADSCTPPDGSTGDFPSAGPGPTCSNMPSRPLPHCHDTADSTATAPTTQDPERPADRQVSHALLPLNTTAPDVNGLNWLDH
ncbi:IS1380 family transposase [Streptomyces sp. NPDC001982]|uniref:IS1380 family transposase n=1 Tax=Streptomyces sp. NPDC001982 TaxID=3154405 RepID=UPI00332569BF